ncbi:MAG TPA: type II toxin-antitoxin system Phd/YefM family antitoxin [Candidatus Binatia bacterium]|jgi:prevent-host-death family protein
MRSVALSEVKDDLSKYLRIAAEEGVIITRRGKAAGVLIGFASEDDWFDYRLENDPRFIRRIETARESLRTGHGIRFEDLEEIDHKRSNRRTARTARSDRTRSKRAGSVRRGRH